MPPHRVTRSRRQEVEEGRNMLVLLVLSAGLIAPFGPRAAALDVDRADGGYTGLLVSIHRDVPYNESIVKNLKALFQSSSEFLNRATNGRVYFKQVTINFPATWPRRPKAIPSRAGLFDRSDVRVDFRTDDTGTNSSSASYEYADQPFTKQIMRCGRPGDFIQLTPTFLLQLNGSTAQRFGNPAYLFVHEWAHFRYGVFDEHGYLNDDAYPITYCHEGKVKLNACSSKIAFTAKTSSGGKCEIDSRCRVASKDCVFSFYQSAENSVESSVMFMPYVDNVSQFCDGTKLRSRQHNDLAPNKQNAICKKRSTWEVISSNGDFEDLLRPDLSNGIHVTFKETQESKDAPKRVVMLLDASESMITNDRLKSVKEALLWYVIHAAEGSQQLAVVTFSSVANVVHSLTPLNNATRVGFLKDIQKLRPSGSTCSIGSGLKEALKALGSNVKKREGGIITLVSGGEEKGKPNIAEVLPEVLKAKVVVNTVALGGKADPNLEVVAAATKGKAYFFNDGQGNMLPDLQDAFIEAAATTEYATRLPVTLLDTETSFSGNLKQDFFIDDGIGKSTAVYIRTTDPGKTGIVHAWLNDPTGSSCAMACSNKITGPDMIIEIRSESAMPGKWSLHLSTHTDNKVHVNVRVKSYVSNETVKPVQVNCRVANLIVNKPEEAIVYAEVSKGRKLLLGAAVSARVTGGSGNMSVWFPLRDDGKDPDNHADDGTYSGYVTEFSGRGRYAVTAIVSSQNTTRLADRKLGSGGLLSAAALQSSKTGAGKDVPSSEYPFDYFVVSNATSEAVHSRGEPVVHHFQRVVSGGSFQVNMTEKKTTPVKPNKIKKLRVFCETQVASDGRPLLKLLWSWDGQQRDSFERFRVIIRGSLDHNKVKTDFRHQTPINQTDIVSGSTAIFPTKAEYTITAAMPAAIAAQLQSYPARTVYFAARIIGAGGLRSDVSEIASVSCRPPAVVTTSSEPTTTPLGRTEPTTITAEAVDPTRASSISTSTLIPDDISSPDAEIERDTTATVVSPPNATGDTHADPTTQVTASADGSHERKTTEQGTPSGTTVHGDLNSTAGISTSTEVLSAKTETTTEEKTAEKTTTSGTTTHGILSSTAGVRTLTDAISAKTETTTEEKATEKTPPSGTTTQGVFNYTAGISASTTATSAETETSSEEKTAKTTTTSWTTTHGTVSSTAGITTSTESSSTRAEITSSLGTLAAHNKTTAAEAFTATAESIGQTTADVTETSTGDQTVTSQLNATEGTSLHGVTDDKPIVFNVQQQKTAVGGLSTGMYALIGGIAAVLVIATIVAIVITRRRKDEDYIVMFTKAGHEEDSA